MTRGSPQASVVIAAHNEGENVRRTVDSLLAASDGTEMEIVLVDDGSSDGSLSFLASPPYREDVRLRPFRCERSRGCIRARHMGVRRARGDYLVFLDAHMALPPGWLAPLVRSLRQWGPTAAVTPAIVPLDEASWTPRGPTGQVVTIDDRFDFVWVREETIYPTGLVGTVLGCCVAMGREWYHQVGGFDLGLHRWGCEFVDLIMKVYATGGACYHEPSSCVGHLFRTAFPYAMSCRDVTYNKLRTGYVHLSDRRFRRLLDRLADEPGFAEAMAEFHNDLSEIDQLRQARHASNQRDAEWFVRMFLPGLCEGPESLAISAGDSSCTLGPCGPTWNKTPAPPDHFPW